MSAKLFKLLDVFGTTVWLKVMRRHHDNAIVLSVKWARNGGEAHAFDIYFNTSEALDFIGEFTAVTQECITAQEEANGKVDKTTG